MSVARLRSVRPILSEMTCRYLSRCIALCPSVCPCAVREECSMVAAIGANGTRRRRSSRTQRQTDRERGIETRAEGQTEGDKWTMAAVGRVTGLITKHDSATG